MEANGPKFQPLRYCKHLFGDSFSVRVYANVRGLTKHLPSTLVLVINVATVMGAIVLGHLSRGQVRRSGHIRGGYVVGSIGMFLGYLFVALFSYLFVMLSMHPFFTP